MVTIINYKKRETDQGKEFFVLEVQGGVEMVQSQTTNKFYATIKKAFIPATFDEATCQALIGTQMSGDIAKEDCEAYEYINKETGELVRLTQRYVYVLEANTPQQNKSLKPAIESFSMNGKSEMAFA